jgi:hypothetical protein
MNKLNRIGVVLIGLALVMPATVSAYNETVNNNSKVPVNVTFEYAGCDTTNFTLAPNGNYTENKGGCCLVKVTGFSIYNDNVSVAGNGKCQAQTFNIVGDKNALNVQE